ncbi:MAG TPA: hypothetical protein PK633_14340, partial [Agitococcus sp.]|nr:hypothetical protein [Agitococcus sp.]
TVKSPNPAFSHVDVPLVSTFVLSSKAGKEVYVEPVIDGDTYRFEVRMGKPTESAKVGTKSGRGGNFNCLISNTPISVQVIREQGKSGLMGQKLLAVVAESSKGRIYISPSNEVENIALTAKPEWKPEIAINHNPRDIRTQLYGLDKYCDLFTPRQLVALTTFSDLVQEARAKAKADALSKGMIDDGLGLDAGGKGASAYADAVGVYLGLAVSKLSDSSNALVSWKPSMDQAIHLYTKQAIPMIWDYAEPNIFGAGMGDYIVTLNNMMRVLDKANLMKQGKSIQFDAQTQAISQNKLISTDPPYYDNIGYADLADFFYVWMRRALKPIYPDLFATMAVPKDEELVATPYRHGSKQKAEKFFLDGMTEAMHRLA